jgi:hypothetical protein
MPLRHTKSGWMWGSKGPFTSKAKALAVARAAYAHKYKEDANSPFQSEVQSSGLQESQKQTERLLPRSWR